MKKVALTLCLLFNIHTLLALPNTYFSRPTGIPTKMTVNIKIDNGHVVCLGNDNYFYAIAINPKSQTWMQWFQGVQPKQPPREFLSSLDKWDVGSPIQLFSVSWADVPQEEFEALGNTSLTTCPMILYNRMTKEAVFARPISSRGMINVLLSYASREYVRGLANGKKVGYNNGYQEGQKWGRFIERTYQTSKDKNEYKRRVREAERRVEEVRRRQQRDIDHLQHQVEAHRRLIDQQRTQRQENNLYNNMQNQQLDNNHIDNRNNMPN